MGQTKIMRRWKNRSSKIYQGFDYTWNGTPKHAGPTRIEQIAESSMTSGGPPVDFMVTVLENPETPEQTELDMGLSDLEDAAHNPSGSLRLRAYYQELLRDANRLMANKPTKR
jgi:hypothetical protein